MAFLDDLYVVTNEPGSRSLAALDTTTQAVWHHCGIASNLGKTRVIAAETGPPPPGIAELGEAVWRGDKAPWARPSGTLTLSVRGRRSGCTRSSSSCSSCHCCRICNAAGFFCVCAPPRGPTTRYGRCPRLSHEGMPTRMTRIDAAIWDTFRACIGGLPEEDAQHAWSIASLPAVLGGLGLHTWRTLLRGARPSPAEDAGPGDWPHGWQMHASRIRNLHYRDRVLLPALPPSSQALLRSQAGPQAGAWLAAIPTEPGTTLLPADMQLALRRRLRQPLPLCRNTCGPTHGCGGLACPRTGLLARRAKIVEHAWVRVAREALGADGQVYLQQWLAHTTAPNVGAEDRRRLDLVVYGATPHGCDATLVSPLTRTGHPQPCTVTIDAAALRVAERRKHAAYPELARAGPQKLVVLGSEVGGRWNEGARSFVRQLVRESPASPAIRAAAAAGWTRRWWSMLSVAVQQAVASTALGGPWQQPLRPGACEGPPLDVVLQGTDPAGPAACVCGPELAAGS